MKVIAKNKRARFDYAIEEVLTAGVVLEGPEVKSVKSGQISLKGAYVFIREGEAYLVGASIAPYQRASQSPAETRDRKLLLHKKEIARIAGQKQSGRHCVPLAVGLERGLVKIELGIGPSRKKYDKRQVLKKREDVRAAKQARVGRTRDS